MNLRQLARAAQKQEANELNARSFVKIRWSFAYLMFRIEIAWAK